MIDHVSVGVRELAKSAAFYEPILAALGFRRLVTREKTVGFGKTYAEFWLNHRPQMAAVPEDSGTHICLRTRTKENVDAFFAAAIERGARDDGKPGLRPEYHGTYYAAFVRDLDGNRIEAVTFVEAA